MPASLADGGGEPAFLAVDGGNSKTEVVLAGDDGEVLGAARGGPSCHQMVGLDLALSNLSSTVREATRVAGRADRVEGRAVAPLGVYCLAGLDLPVDDQRVGEGLAKLSLTERQVLHNDTMAVFRAGSRAGWGLGLVCGSGINCAALAPDGRAVRFPAMGELSGDFTTGGAWLGTRGLGLALRAGDGRGRPTALRALVAEALRERSAEEVLEGLYTGRLPFDRLTELAPVVLRAAAEGDGPARSAVDALADEVVAMAAAAIRRLHLEDDPIEVVTGGGIFRSGEPGFSARVREGIRAVAPAALFRPVEAPPVVGSALLAADLLGLGADAERRLRAEVDAALGTGGA